MQRNVSFLILFLLNCLNGACAQRAGEPAAALPTLEAGVVVDEQDAAMELDGVWQAVAVDGAYGGQCAWAPVNPTVPNEWDYTMYESRLSAYAYVRPDLPRAGTYAVLAHVCLPPASALAGQTLATSAEIQVHPTRGRVAYTPVEVDLARLAASGWQSLGQFYLERDGSLIMSNLQGPVNGIVVVDAFRFVWRSAEREETKIEEGPAPSPSPTP